MLLIVKTFPLVIHFSASLKLIFSPCLGKSRVGWIGIFRFSNAGEIRDYIYKVAEQFFKVCGRIPAAD
jgi:hypothetical protein